MRSSAAVIICLSLTGCETVKGWFKPEDPKPPQVVKASPDPSQLSTVGEKQTKVDSRVASSVTVMVENKDKPAVVEAEGKLALSYLPAPAPADVSYARERAAKALPSEYASQTAYAKQFVEKIEAEWKAAELQAKKNSEALAASLTKVNQLESEISKVRKDAELNLRKVEAEASRNIWTMTGAAMAVIGAVASAVVGFRIGGIILAAGAFCGAMPFVYGSPYFAWIVGSTLLIACGLGIWRLWDYVRDRNNDNA